MYPLYWTASKEGTYQFGRGFVGLFVNQYQMLHISLSSFSRQQKLDSFTTSLGHYFIFLLAITVTL